MATKRQCECSDRLCPAEHNGRDLWTAAEAAPCTVVETVR